MRAHHIYRGIGHSVPPPNVLLLSPGLMNANFLIVLTQQVQAFLSVHPIWNDHLVAAKSLTKYSGSINSNERLSLTIIHHINHLQRSKTEKSRVQYGHFLHEHTNVASIPRLLLQSLKNDTIMDVKSRENSTTPRCRCPVPPSRTVVFTKLRALHECRHGGGPSESTKDNVPTQSVPLFRLTSRHSPSTTCRTPLEEEENPVENPFWHLKSNTNRPASGGRSWPFT